MASAEQPDVFCDNCQQSISAQAMVMHRLQCERHNYFCKKCKEVMCKAEQEEHDEKFHKVTVCECGESVEAADMDKHQKVTCSFRMEPCDYCSLPVKFKDLKKHVDDCGNRTEKCEGCDTYVKKKDEPWHAGDACLKMRNQKRMAEAEAAENEKASRERAEAASRKKAEELAAQSAGSSSSVKKGLSSQSSSSGKAAASAKPATAKPANAKAGVRSTAGVAKPSRSGSSSITTKAPSATSSTSSSRQGSVGASETTSTTAASSYSGLPLEVVATMELKPFAQTPWVEFGEANVGKQVTLGMRLNNPTNKTVNVCLESAPVRKGFSCDCGDIDIPAGREEVITVSWKPKEVGSVREALYLYMNGKERMKVVLVGDAVPEKQKIRKQYSSSRDSWMTQPTPSKAPASSTSKVAPSRPAGTNPIRSSGSNRMSGAVAAPARTTIEAKVRSSQAAAPTRRLPSPRTTAPKAVAGVSRGDSKKTLWDEIQEEQRLQDEMLALQLMKQEMGDKAMSDAHIAAAMQAELSTVHTSSDEQMARALQEQEEFRQSEMLARQLMQEGNPHDAAFF